MNDEVVDRETNGRLLSMSLYLVRIDSLVEFPIIGNINLVGKTIKEAELYLEKIFSKFYVESIYLF